MFFDPSTVNVVADQIIGGRRVPGARSADVVSPSHGGTARAITWASQEQVDTAVTTARAAWEDSGWGRMGPRDRAAVLHRFADVVDANAEELCRLESLVSARIYSEAMARDVKVVSGVLRYFAEYADKVDGSVTPTPQDSLSLTVHEPDGVVAAIAPWNFPMILAAWKFAPALAAGNAVVLKPSEMTPFSAARIAELAIEAGLPAGIFNVVQGDASVGAALVRHPGVDYFTFTGSSATGARIMADAAMTGVEAYIAGAVADGATLAGGGGRPAHLARGYFVEPTVFGNVDNASRLAREEVFGPVLAVIPADDEEDAIAVANDSDFGLAGAVYTHDADRAYAVMRRMRTGTISHNAPRIDFGIAFGGFKQSGVGREGGIEGLMPFLETKTLLLDALPSHVSAAG